MKEIIAGGQPPRAREDACVEAWRVDLEWPVKSSRHIKTCVRICKC